LVAFLGVGVEVRRLGYGLERRRGDEEKGWMMKLCVATRMNALADVAISAFF
jgi:hypothetical protein